MCISYFIILQSIYCTTCSKRRESKVNMKQYLPHCVFYGLLPHKHSCFYDLFVCLQLLLFCLVCTHTDVHTFALVYAAIYGLCDWCLAEMASSLFHFYSCVWHSLASPGPCSIKFYQPTNLFKATVILLLKHSTPFSKLGST